jgi:biopolymer transport protein ExbD
MLSVDRDSIYLDHKKLGLTEEVVRKPQELLSRLAQLRAQWERSHPNEAFPGKINLQADRAVSSATVSRIMAMLATESYGSILLAVMTGEAS